MGSILSLDADMNLINSNMPIIECTRLINLCVWIHDHGEEGTRHSSQGRGQWTKCPRVLSRRVSPVHPCTLAAVWLCATPSSSSDMFSRSGIGLAIFTLYTHTCILIEIEGAFANLHGYLWIIFSSIGTKI